MLRLSAGLKERGFEQLAVCREESESSAQFAALGVEVLKIPKRDVGRLRASGKLRSHLKLHSAEILHAHDGAGQSIAWLAARGLPSRRIASRRVTFLPKTPFIHKWKYGLTCDGLIAVSGYIRDLLVQSGVPAAKIEVIPDGIDIPAALPGPEVRLQSRQDWGISADAFVLGHVGAFTREKGQDVAIAAMGRVAPKLAGAKLLLVGELPRKLWFDLQAQAAWTGGSVRLLGRQEKLDAFFAAIDLFIMPSRSEGLGSAALLAMARGVPVIASRLGGLPEVVIDGETGLLVEPDSPQALAAAIFQLAQDDTMRRKLGEFARLHARKFSTEVLVERTVNYYQRVAAGR
jgi:L-malate glycosyltransferase